MKVGFIGLGIMGTPMALHLVNKGHQLFVHTRSQVPAALTDAGAITCRTPAEVAKNAEVIFTMVPDTPDVELVLFGENGVASALGKGKKVTVGVRPEDLQVSDKGDGLKVDVDVVEELGADGYLYGHTEIDGQRVDIVARVDGRSHPNAGDKITVTPVPAHVHTFDPETGDRLGDKAIAASTTAAAK